MKFNKKITVYLVLLLMVGAIVFQVQTNLKKKNNSSNVKKISVMQLQNIKSKKYVEDFRDLYKILKENYPYFELNKYD